MKAGRPKPAAASLPAGWSTAHDHLRRAIPVWWLRFRLRFTPQQWLAQAPAAINAAFDWTGRAVEHLIREAATRAARYTTKSAIRAFRWRNVALVASAPFLLPAEWRGAILRIFAYLGALYAMTLMATAFFAQMGDDATLQPPPRPVWNNIENPWPAFALAAPGFDDSQPSYAIRRHPQGGRKDVFSFGELGGTQRFMNVEIYRPGVEASDFGRAEDAIRSLGDEQGRVLGIRSSMPIASKFGTFETFEFAIAPFSGYNCTGFVHVSGQPRVQIRGLSCNMNLLVNRSTISCALDRLTLTSAGSDPEIAKLFAHAEQKRHFCGQRDPLLYATPRRADVTGSVSSRPPLRGRVR